MLSSMISKKKVSDASEPTQPDRSRRFVRRNSFHTLNCRSGSLKKLKYNSEELMAQPIQVCVTQPAQKDKKKDVLKTQTQTFFKDFASPFDNSVKRASGSMRIDPRNSQKKCQMQKFQSLKRQISIREQQIDLLQGQCKKLKMQVTQQRQKRKTLQQQIRCNKLQLKRLEKRLQKYGADKQKYEKERQIVISHMQELQRLKFNEQTITSHNFKLKVIEAEVLTLRKELQKSRSQRQRELIVQLQKIIADKFTVDNQLKSALISNNTMAKQLQQAMQEVEEVRQSVYKTVISSYQYTELRQRYRKMLLQYKQLREQMSILQHAYHNKTIEHTILTVSDHSQGIFQQ